MSSINPAIRALTMMPQTVFPGLIILILVVFVVFYHGMQLALALGGKKTLHLSISQIGAPAVIQDYLV